MDSAMASGNQDLAWTLSEWEGKHRKHSLVWHAFVPEAEGLLKYFVEKEMKAFE